MNRRTFVLASTATAAWAAPPSDQVRLGLIGSGGRGRNVLREFKKFPQVRPAAVCDVYEPNLERGLSDAGPGTTAYRDYRKLLDDSSIDAVLIGTPEHWHHRMMIDAAEAGKDVYLEKPLCHTPEEGVEMMAAEERTRRIVQVGMQRRSYNLYGEAQQMRRRGDIGTVRMVRTYWLNHRLQPVNRDFEGPIDWEQWLGPAPAIGKDPRRFFDWRNYADYSGGIVIDQGAHIYDAIHMIMDAGYPSAVTAVASKIHKPHVDLPESWVVTAEYPEDFLAIFTINYSAMVYERRADQLNAYDGDKARLDIGREFLRVYPSANPGEPSFVKDQPGGFAKATTDHVGNFLDCIKSRNRPRAPVEIGFQAALVLQMANLSVRHGCRVRWDTSTQRVVL